MVFIESAFWGDEKSTKNVTDVLKGKIEGNKLAIEKVDDKLIPAFTVAPKGELKPEDVVLIRQKAEKACGGADQDCIKLRTSELTQEVLRAKANDEITEGAAAIIKGKRLTVNIRDENGKRVRKVVPENGKFELEGLSPTDPRKPGEALPDGKYLTKYMVGFTQASVATFIWVFGIVATYTLFAQQGWEYAAPALAFIAFLLPGSGYAMILIYFIGKSFMDNYTSMM